MLPPRSVRVLLAFARPEDLDRIALLFPPFAIYSRMVIIRVSQWMVDGKACQENQPGEGLPSIHNQRVQAPSLPAQA